MGKELQQNNYNQFFGLEETTTPSTEDSIGKIYTKSNNILYFQDGNGIEHFVGETVYGEMKISENAVETTINASSEWHAIDSLFSTGLVKGFTYQAGIEGVIASTSGTGTVGTINDIGHDLSIGDIITINDTTNFNGIFAVNTVPNVDSFTILTSATSNDTGFWQRGACITVDAGGDGIYKGSWSATGISSSVGQVFDFSPVVNTTIATAATARRTFSNTDFGSFSGTELISLSEGDKIIFIIRNNTSAGNITIRALDLNLHKL